MKVFWRLQLTAALIALATLCLSAGRAAGETYYYGVEINGVLCGYSKVDASSVSEDGKELILIKHEMLVMLSALGSEFNSEVKLTYHVDPESGWFTYHDSDVKQGQIHLGSEILIEDGMAHITDPISGDEESVELEPGVALENTLFYFHVKRDLADGGLTEKSYEIFEVRDEKVMSSTYTKIDEERIELVGKDYDAIVVRRVTHDTGLKAKMWIDADSGLLLKSELPNNRGSYLADESVVKKIKLANLDDSIASKVSVAIADVPGITYMKVKAELRPTGLRVTPESLNVPGQTFTGTVEENLVEGVFEVEQPRYGGAGAPSFPPDYSWSEEIAGYLEPDGFIESDDPVLIAKARELTEGAVDSWDAACRLSEWVSENISYAIPGGGTARKTYDVRAGECGAHSMLVAAFCRAVGIPARVIWGCMYVPNFGGSFGQHGWNEIYMGDAGWIQVDATASEPDFVDSGHIRVGIYQSTTTALNPGKMEIIEYRVASGDAADLSAAGEKYAPYVGDYNHPMTEDVFKVLVKDGGLAVDIPNKMVLGFNDPDEEGRWYCKLSKNLYCTFERDDAGEVVELQLHELVPLPRKGESEEMGEEVPEEFKPYLGVYLLAQLNAEFTVLFMDGGLAVHDTVDNKKVKLQPPNEEGGWVDEFNKNTIYFELDDEGAVTSMTIDSTSRFRR